MGAGLATASGQACFTFGSDSIGCAPLTVQFQNCSPAGQAVAYNYDFLTNPNLGSFQTAPSGDGSFTYLNPGIYEVRQITTGSTLGNAARRTVRVFGPNSKPVFTVNSCPNLVRLYIKDSIFRQCLVEWGPQGQTAQSHNVSIPAGGAYVDLPVIVTGETIIEVGVTGTNPVNCGDTRLTTSLNVFPSLPTTSLTSALGSNLNGAFGLTVNYDQNKDVAFSLSIHGIDPQGDVILMDSTRALSTGPATVNFSISDRKKYVIRLRQGIGCADQTQDSLVAINPFAVSGTSLGFKTLAPNNGQIAVQREGSTTVALSLSDSSYADTTPFRCNEERCYKLVLTESSRQYTSYPTCLRGDKGQAANLRLRASRWDPEEKAHTLIFGPSAAVQEFSGDGVSTVDLFPPIALLAQPQCTPIGFTDSCGHVHADSTFCPFVLNVKLEKDVRVVSYTPPSGPGLPQDLDYILIARGLDGLELGRESVNGPVLKDRSRYPAQHLVYQMMGIPQSHPSDTSLSNPVEIIRESELVIADAFSPNDDGINDTLTAQTRFIAEASISIFDSWGTPVYKSGLPFAWAGQSPRGKAPAGNYLAVIHAKTQEGETFVSRKWITIAQ